MIGSHTNKITPQSKESIISNARNERKDKIYNAVTVYRPLEILLELLGSSRPTFENGLVKEISVWHKIRLIVLVIILSVSIYLNFEYIFNYLSNDDKSYEVFYNGMILLSAVPSCCLQVFWYPKIHALVLHRMLVVDSLLPIRGDEMCRVIHRKSAIAAIILSSYMGLFSLGFLIISEEIITRKIFEVALAGFACAYYALLLQFIFDISFLTLRTTLLNEVLLKMVDKLYDEPCDIDFVTSSNDFIMLLYSIRIKNVHKYIIHSELNMESFDKIIKCYSRLLDIVPMLNKAYSYQVLSFIILIFSTQLLCVALGIHLFLLGNELRSTSTLILAAYLLVILLNLVFICDDMNSEFEKSKNILHKILHSPKLDDLEAEQVQDLLRLCDSYDKTIMPFNLFTVNLSMLSGFFSALTSYTIILIQFMHSSPRKYRP